MLYPRYYFTLLPRILSSAFLLLLVASVICISSLAQQPADLERKAENPVDAAEQERKSLLNMGWMATPPKAVIKARPNGGAERNVEIKSEEQYDQGNVTVAIGKVEVFDGETLIIADRITYNNATSDVLAEGNVYLVEQGQRLAGDVLEFNYKTRRGMMRNPTAFTNATPDGTMVVIDAKRADKTGEDTYNLDNAILTACQEKTPKWTFTARRARIRLDHRANVYNAFFRIKNIPVLW